MYGYINGYDFGEISVSTQHGLIKSKIAQNDIF